MMTFYRENKRAIKWIIAIILVLLYIAYFVYALVKVGIHTNIGLIVLTCIAVVIAILYFLYKKFWDKVYSTLVPAREKLALHWHRWIKW